MARTNKNNTGKHRVWPRPAAVIAAVMVVLVTIYAVTGGRILEAIPHGIIRQKADISQERLDKGYVDVAQLDGQISLGEFKIGVAPLTHELDGWHANLLVMDTRLGFGRDMSLRVGQTITDTKYGIAVTLVQLGKYEGAQAVRILVEPYQDGPSIRQKADIPPERLGNGTLRTVRLGTTAHFGSYRVLTSWNLNHDKNGGRSLSMRAYDQDSKDDYEEWGNYRPLTLKLGETQEAKGICSVTFVALTDVDGHQGVTLLATPVSEQ